MSQSAAARIPDPEHESSTSSDLTALAERIGAIAHRFNNSLTTIIGLVDWHLDVENHADPLAADFAKMRAAATQAREASAEIQRLIAQAQRGGAPRAEAPLRSTADLRAVTSTGEQTQAPAPPATVLIIDDQPDVRNSLCVMIRTLGYAAHAVPSGEAALVWLASNRASMVFTDLGMPGMDGAAVAKAIAEQQPTVPVVLMTGWGAFAAPPPGVHRVVAKPIRMAQLRECLAALAGSDRTS
jgi:CheY-like chemotaxis protein